MLSILSMFRKSFLFALHEHPYLLALVILSDTALVMLAYVGICCLLRGW